MAMNSIVVIVAALFVAVSFSPDIIKFKHGVEFDHKGHQTEKVGSCTVCHGKHIGKIDGFGKEWAHTYCIDCHKLHNEGRPANCAGCHKTMGSLK